MSNLEETIRGWQDTRKADNRVKREGARPVGRPRFADGKARTLVLQTRVSKSEMLKLKRAAESDGQDLSAWVRDALLRLTR